MWEESVRRLKEGQAVKATEKARIILQAVDEAYSIPSYF
jgi:hypothetical protein